MTQQRSPKRNPRLARVLSAASEQNRVLCSRLCPSSQLACTPFASRRQQCPSPLIVMLADPLHHTAPHTRTIPWPAPEVGRPAKPIGSLGTHQCESSLACLLGCVVCSRHLHGLGPCCQRPRAVLCVRWFQLATYLSILCGCRVVYLPPTDYQLPPPLPSRHARQTMALGAWATSDLYVPPARDRRAAANGRQVPN